MKCDKLYPASLFEFEKVLKGKSNKLFYAKADVDAAIAELKEIIGKNKTAFFVDLGIVANDCEKLKAENAELKAKLERVHATAHAESVDARMRECRLRRALYKACFNWAHFAVAFFAEYKTKEKWRKMESKCLKKAEEYK